MRLEKAFKVGDEVERKLLLVLDFRERKLVPTVLSFLGGTRMRGVLQVRFVRISLVVNECRQ